MWRRSDLAWKKIFKDAGLTLAKEQIQYGLPEGLYEVKMYVFRIFVPDIMDVQAKLCSPPRYALR